MSFQAYLDNIQAKTGKSPDDLIAPIILGSGRPLFRQGIAQTNLSLHSTRQLLTGGVILKYVKA